MKNITDLIANLTLDWREAEVLKKEMAHVSLMIDKGGDPITIALWNAIWSACIRATEEKEIKPKLVELLATETTALQDTNTKLIKELDDLIQTTQRVMTLIRPPK